MRKKLAVILAIGLLLGACSSGDSGEAAVFEETSTDMTGGGEDGAQPTPDEAENMRVEFDGVDDRQVIRSASLDLQADDTRAAFEEIVAMVESEGGFVADATVHPTSGDEDQPTVTMTLRIPADRLTETMTAIKDSVEEVVAESQSAEDVTEQFIDLEARLTNLEALETELRALLREVRTQENSDPEKILTVFNELSSVRGQIEQIQGQLNYLEDATSLATLQVQLTRTPSTAPIVDQPWSPGQTTRDALGDLVAGLQGIADWGINFAIFALPLLLITVGPVVLIAVFVYRRFFRKPPSDPTPAET